MADALIVGVRVCDGCAKRKKGCILEGGDPNGATLCPACVAAIPPEYPPLVGRLEAAALLGVKPTNLRRQARLAPPLQERGIEGFEVKATTLWPRAEIEALLVERKAESKDRR